MGKSSPTPPAAPDPYKTASAQTGSNIGTAIANAAIGNANTVGPQGSTNFNVTGNTQWTDPESGKTYNIPQYTATTTLSPEQQQLYNQQTALGSKLNNLATTQTDKISSLLSKPLSFSNLPTVPTDFSADRKAVEDAIYSRLDPQLDRDRAALETKLVNQGFQRGSAAFNTEMDAANRQANDARMQAVLNSGQEESRLYGMASDARNRAMQEQLQLRNQPINEISALMSGGQVSMPQATQYNAPQVANTDVTGAVYNSAALNNQNYQAQLQQNNAALGGLFGLGSTALYGGMKYGLNPLNWSDRRLKRDIRAIGVKLPSGVNLYEYRYLWDDAPRVGVMADEVEAVAPAAVHEISGFKAVDYDMVLRAA
ncbi:tail fiber domain-containing protein [Bradyrhizobium sp. USDA 3458]|uniref:tail fiber domain-containing protein n=1 Tax=Bradyrhizobium sp. USDA 3458 TaxID=2591461 RepID=UPI0011416855|nr:tail fiber domain-containing protein [Bradyrhizobium sp. USDA 3458]